MRRFSPYLFGILFISIWWGVVFIGGDEGYTLITPGQQKVTPSGTLVLSKTERKELITALSGNIDQMHRLFSMWEVDARSLCHHKIPGCKRMDEEKALNFYELYRSLNKEPETHSKKYLPQTYAAAALLLALVSPEEIVAIPEGTRRQDELYPTLLTSQIKLSIDRYLSETIAQQKPDIAFVAPYSNPQTVETLSQQGVTLYTLNSPETLDDLIETILTVGNLTGRPKKAHMLALFVEAACLTSDNRLAYLLSESKNRPKKIAYLTYYNTFHTPAEKNITRKLLKRVERLGFDFFKPYREDSTSWSHPVTMDALIRYNPDSLILSMDSRARSLRLDASIQEVAAYTNDSIFFVDDNIQLSPTQHIALAYFDLAESVAKSLE